MQTYNPRDIIGKSLIAKRTVPVYSIANANNRFRIGFVKSGNSLGVVRSFIQKPDGIYWEFDQPLGAGTYYAKHQTGDFNVSSLRTQGVISREEQKEQERKEELNWFERIVDKTQSTGSAIQKDLVKAGAIVLVIALAPSIIRGINAATKALDKK